jgi:hypothetical protein
VLLWCGCAREQPAQPLLRSGIHAIAFA